MPTIVKLPVPKLDSDKRLSKEEEGVLNYISHNPINLLHIKPEYKTNQRLLLAAITKNYQIWGYVDSAIQTDSQFRRISLTKNHHVLTYFSDEFKGRSDNMLAAMRCNINAIHYALPELRHNKDFIKKAYYISSDTLSVLPQALWTDLEFITELSVFDSQILSHLPRQFSCESEFLLALCSNNIRILSNAPRLANNGSFMLKVCQSSPQATQYISAELMQNEAFRGELRRLNLKIFTPILVLKKNKINENGFFQEGSLDEAFFTTDEKALSQLEGEVKALASQSEGEAAAQSSPYSFFHSDETKAHAEEPQVEAEEARAHKKPRP